MIHLPWSHSSISTFRKCPQRYKFQYIERLPQPGLKSEALLRGSRIHAELEHFLTHKRAPVPEEAESFRDELIDLRKKPGMRAEARVEFNDSWREVPSKSPGSWCVMILDATYVEGTVGKVIDFKTGKVYPDDHVDQGNLYSIGMMFRQQLTEVETEFWYLDRGYGHSLEVKRAQVRKIANGYERQVLTIDAEKRFAPNPSRLCSWCPYSKTVGGPCRAG